MNTAEILQDFTRRGITLYLDGDQLRYRAKPGTLTDDDKERIRANKAAILKALKKPDEAQLEAFLERAAIMEFDGKLSRRGAEYRAFRLVWPGGGCTMLSAPSTVEEALEHARLMFGGACESMPIESSREVRHG